ncbi:protein of unknown function [Hyphomicrobium sp. 1Nfss2.1]
MRLLCMCLQGSASRREPPLKQYFPRPPSRAAGTSRSIFYHTLDGFGRARRQRHANAEKLCVDNHSARQAAGLAADAAIADRDGALSGREAAD